MGAQEPTKRRTEFHTGHCLGGDNIIFCQSLAVKEDFDASQHLSLFHRRLHFGQEFHFAGQVVAVAFSTRMPSGASGTGVTVGSVPWRTGTGES